MKKNLYFILAMLASVSVSGQDNDQLNHNDKSFDTDAQTETNREVTIDLAGAYYPSPDAIGAQNIPANAGQHFSHKNISHGDVILTAETGRELKHIQKHDSLSKCNPNYLADSNSSGNTGFWKMLLHSE